MIIPAIAHWFNHPGGLGHLPSTNSSSYSSIDLPSDLPATWKWLPWLLLIGLVLRILIALSGEYVIHPDEAFQYLEQGHKLAFDYGISYWEYYYQSRHHYMSYLIAGVLLVFEKFNAGDPVYYIPGVKIMFCIFSMLIPFGMYHFTRNFFGESAARLALVLGCFWVDMLAFAHKPLTEYFSTILLLATFASFHRLRNCSYALLLVVGMASVAIFVIRFQYFLIAPIYFFLIYRYCYSWQRILILVIGQWLAFIGFGLVDSIENTGFYQSLFNNLKVNFELDALRQGESTVWQYVIWLTQHSLGLWLLIIPLSLYSRFFAKHSAIWAMIILIIILHSYSSHKEFRFIFIVFPLLLILFSDICAREASKVFATVGRFKLAYKHLAVTVLLIPSTLGLFNLLPENSYLYYSFSYERPQAKLIGNKDSLFSVYHHLHKDPELKALWQSDIPYFNTPGYYHLHRELPIYDVVSFLNLFLPYDAQKYISHIIIANDLPMPVGIIQATIGANVPATNQPVAGEVVLEDNSKLLLPLLFAQPDDTGKQRLVYWTQSGKVLIPGFKYKESIDNWDIWVRTDNEQPIVTWKHYRPVFAAGLEFLLREVLPQYPDPDPRNYITLVEPSPDQ